MKIFVGVALLVVSVVGDDSSGSLSSAAKALYNTHNTHGCISKSGFEQIFLEMDTWPNDQRLSEAEFLDGWTQRHLNDADFGPLFFSEVDHNHDNEIEKAEIDHLYNLFDLDGNRCINYQEFSYTWNALFNV